MSGANNILAPLSVLLALSGCATTSPKQDSASSAPCDIVKPSNRADLIALGFSIGGALSSLQFSSSNFPTGVSYVDVVKGKRKVYIAILSSEQPIILKFRGDVKMIDHVTVLYEQPVGIIGLDKSKISFVSRADCVLNKISLGALKDVRNGVSPTPSFTFPAYEPKRTIAAITQIFGKEISVGRMSYATGIVNTGSEGLDEIVAWKDAKIPAGNIRQSDLKYRSNFILGYDVIDAKDVIATHELKQPPLPYGVDGFMPLLKSGILTEVTADQIEQWKKRRLASGRPVGPAINSILGYHSYMAFYVHQPTMVPIYSNAMYFAPDTSYIVDSPYDQYVFTDDGGAYTVRTWDRYRDAPSVLEIPYEWKRP